MQVILKLMDDQFSKSNCQEVSINMFDINENFEIISKLSKILEGADSFNDISFLSKKNPLFNNLTELQEKYEIIEKSKI